MEGISGIRPPVNGPVPLGPRRPTLGQTAGIAPATAAAPPANRQGNAPVAPAGEKALAEIVDALRQRFSPHDVVMRRDDRIDDVVVEVRDHETGQVVRQIPTEELINLRLQLREITKATGLLVDSTT